MVAMLFVVAAAGILVCVCWGNDRAVMLLYAATLLIYDVGLMFAHQIFPEDSHHTPIFWARYPGRAAHALLFLRCWRWFRRCC
ncbi:hypothetical protein [uncultured Tateyamaria sp.]|uniref:hypothetical protein n=1 Tax=uncultured Tateyamaria sp. TaxID=455651 RepID=UPI00261419B4|nr:hypothetical protein [uncultured Tateyamaria sp.]